MKTSNWLEIPSWLKWPIISTIDWTHNIVLPSDVCFPENLERHISRFKTFISSLTDRETTMENIEKRLARKYWAWRTIETPEWRIACCLWWKNTNIARIATQIIIPWSEMNQVIDSQHNMWRHVLDPIWWASRCISPTKNYWFLWKIPELRPDSPEFNKELYEEIMNSIIKVSEILWYAVEVSQDETAIMPVVAISWAENLITPFSTPKEKSDVSTAKHYILNNY